MIQLDRMTSILGLSGIAILSGLAGIILNEAARRRVDRSSRRALGFEQDIDLRRYAPRPKLSRSWGPTYPIRKVRFNGMPVRRNRRRA